MFELAAAFVERIITTGGFLRLETGKCCAKCATGKSVQQIQSARSASNDYFAGGWVLTLSDDLFGNMPSRLCCENLLDVKIEWSEALIWVLSGKFSILWKTSSEWIEGEDGKNAIFPSSNWNVECAWATEFNLKRANFSMHISWTARSWKEQRSDPASDNRQQPIVILNLTRLPQVFFFFYF